MCPFKIALAPTKCSCLRHKYVPINAALAPTKRTCLRHKYVPIQDHTCIYQAYMLETEVCTHSMVNLPLPNACVLKASDLGRRWIPTSAKETAKVSPPVPCKCRVPHVPKPRSIFKHGVGGHCLTVHPRACTCHLC